MVNFKIGMKVVCINDREFSKAGEQVPLQDRIYTIRDMFYINERLVLRFEEIVNFPRPYMDIGYVECCFYAAGFRPMEYKSATADILAKFTLTEERADVKIDEPALA